MAVADQKEIKELLEAVRKAAYAEGYAAARMEAALDRAGGAPEPKSPFPARLTPRAPEEAGRKTDGATIPYLSRTTFGMTVNMANEYLHSVTHPVGPTEIIKNTYQASGIRLSMTSVRRALDELTTRGELVQVDNSRWQVRRSG